MYESRLKSGSTINQKCDLDQQNVYRRDSKYYVTAIISKPQPHSICRAHNEKTCLIQEWFEILT